ncbi:hypothetical protein E2C01_054801 [Portunus trituberculatus]|uniref:Uncharacterized protein n=1 Tax=Portunus trituberculatus TaxID=210409 RepID=A0A5B7GTN1_PORTR|nr:hypothetical protein [Portunus trituberculatus]
MVEVEDPVPAEGTGLQTGATD